jgi:serine/threonine protein kinase
MTVQSLFRKKMCELGFDKKYRQIKLIGKGSTATVYLVERISDGKFFAAKVISLKSSNDRNYETFVNESKLLRILKHKNIINLESVYIHKKELIQVMEYFKGGTLLEKIRNVNLPILRPASKTKVKNGRFFVISPMH